MDVPSGEIQLLKGGAAVKHAVHVSHSAGIQHTEIQRVQRQPCGTCQLGERIVHGLAVPGVQRHISPGIGDRKIRQRLMPEPEVHGDGLDLVRDLDGPNIGIQVIRGGAPIRIGHSITVPGEVVAVIIRLLLGIEGHIHYLFVIIPQDAVGIGLVPVLEHQRAVPRVGDAGIVRVDQRVDRPVHAACGKVPQRVIDGIVGSARSAVKHAVRRHHGIRFEVAEIQPSGAAVLEHGGHIRHGSGVEARQVQRSGSV